MKKISRTRCAVGINESIYPLYTLKDFPISMSCVDTDPDQDLFADMIWGYSESGHIQLVELLDPDLIYKNYHNPGTVGKTWTEHHLMFAEFIKQDKFSNVLEIGGASGNLVKHFINDSSDFKWTIVEPGASVGFDDPRVSWINEYFENLMFDHKFDTVVHSHCFEHVYNPISFLNKINDILSHGDYHYISIPNMKYWLENNFSNTLHFEHTFYVDIHVLTHLLETCGFEVVDQIINNHSIFVKAVKLENAVVSNTDFSYIKPLFENYINTQITDVNQIKQQLDGRNCYVFGGHIFSQTLINLGLQQSQITCILDNDIKKQEKRLYGTSCVVKSPKILMGVEGPVVVVRAGPYTNEIRNSILDINPTTIFL